MYRRILGNLRRGSFRGLSQRLSTDAEKAMTEKLTLALEATDVRVEDKSGGCGSFYAIMVESPKFAGLTTLKQHMLVKSTLADEMAQVHGATVETRVPKSTA
mmetsp:Transcript_139/g.215  ORF Transcript_139/g.215 Transcript_139/m.215 type:complete len:102 (+) Transcript_139:33-338(+)